MFQILTDTGCDLPPQLLDAHQIHTVPFHYTVGDTMHTDVLGDTHSNDAVYASLHEAEKVTTTQINVGEYHDFFAPFVVAETPILYVGFSGALSGSLASAEQAKAMLLDEHPQAQIEIVDSLAASGAEGLLVLAAAAKRDAGVDLMTTAASLRDQRLHVNHWVAVADLDHLVRGGRLPKAAAVVGRLLNIVPLLTIAADGTVKVAGKARSQAKALKTLADHAMLALADDPDQLLILAASGDWTSAERLRDLILAERPDAKLLLRPVSLTIACHTGYGCVAVFGITKRPRS